MRPTLAVLVATACGGATTRDPPSTTCPDTAVELASQDDVDGYPGCPLAHGLVIRTGVDLDLSRSRLQYLHAIDGDLLIGPSVGVHDVTLGELATVRGTIRVVGNGNLESLVLPHLTHAGAISIAGDVELRSVSLPSLAGVDHDLVIERTPELALVDVTDLQSIGGELAITDAPALVALEAPSLARAGGVRLERTGLTAEIEAALRAVSSAGNAPAQ